MVPAGISKRAVRWFYEHVPGVTMVYRSMAHVHFDTGPYHKLACGGCGGKRRTRLAHVDCDACRISLAFCCQFQTATVTASITLRINFRRLLLHPRKFHIFGGALCATAKLGAFSHVR